MEVRDKFNYGFYLQLQRFEFIRNERLVGRFGFVLFCWRYGFLWRDVGVYFFLGFEVGQLDFS